MLLCLVGIGAGFLSEQLLCRRTWCVRLPLWAIFVGHIENMERFQAESLYVCAWFCGGGVCQINSPQFNPMAFRAGVR